jgi:hypothetical protein
VLVHADVIRGHPVGARSGPVLALWPGWSATLRAIARDPLADLDWIDVVGPTSAAGERLLARDADDALVDARIVALQARSAEPGEPHVDPGTTPVAAARLDGSLRVLFRAQPHLVAAVPVAEAPARSRALRRGRVLAPDSPEGEAMRADLPRPHAVLPPVPEQVERLRMRVIARADGGAELDAEGACATPDDAAAAAGALRATIAEHDTAIVRMVTRGLLGGVVVGVEGSTVRVRVPATRDQAEALLAIGTALAEGAPR